MSTFKRIAVDAMGGDVGVACTVPATLRALQEFSDLQITLIGQQQRIAPFLEAAAGPELKRLEVQHCEASISDQDKPAVALRRGRNSSLYMTVEAVRDGRADAMVSAGNTGAMLMTGRHLLKTLPGISKPAITATLPGVERSCFLLDVGANPQADADLLFQFAVMGSALAESLQQRPATVGLLNIGAEQHKGNDVVQQAAERLLACEEIDYRGFVEANTLFETDLDVIVCDGFVGNVTIKASAGVANVIKGKLQTHWEQETHAVAQQRLRAVEREINPQRFNGASLLGLSGCMVKSHGNATSEGFYFAIAQAVREAELRVPQLIAQRVAAIIQRSADPLSMGLGQ